MQEMILHTSDNGCRSRPRESPLRGRKYAIVGQMEQIMLLAILRSNNRAYGSQISKEIKSRANLDLSVGALYATLTRMENKGFIESLKSDSRTNRHYFRVTGKGRKLLMEALSLIDSMRADMEVLTIA